MKKVLLVAFLFSALFCFSSG